MQELQHFGVPGMKWGKRTVGRVERKYSSSGKAAGRAEYYKEKAKREYDKHENSAQVLDKTAKRLERQGGYLRAEVARKGAAALRARGANVKAENEAEAKRYVNKAAKLQTKASEYATKKRVDVGKQRINEIMKKSKAYAKQQEADFEQRMKEQEIEDRFGESGVDTYRRIQGRN